MNGLEKLIKESGMEDFQKELEKLKFQMKLVGESLSFEEHPMASLVIEMDWSNQELNIAHDIFEIYDSQLEAGEKPNWIEFESEFDRQLGVGYQMLKLVVLAFYRNFQWTRVCEVYANENDCMEFHSITKS